MPKMTTILGQNLSFFSLVVVSHFPIVREALLYASRLLRRVTAVTPNFLSYYFFLFRSRHARRRRLTLALQNRDVLGQGRVTYASGSDGGGRAFLLALKGTQITRLRTANCRWCLYVAKNVTLNLYDFEYGEMSEPRTRARARP